MLAFVGLGAMKRVDLHVFWPILKGLFLMDKSREWMAGANGFGLGFCGGFIFQSFTVRETERIGCNYE